MCGIIGILGDHEVSPQLVEALKRLEYRGYDSAGVATVDAGGRLDRRRAVGKLVNLSDRLVHEPLPGHAGIGHTRWATHGAATEQNAHPHRRGPVAVVHNGIIENFRELRDEVIALGLQPESQTDTETVALLTAWHMSQGMDPIAAARATLGRLHGAFALAFLFDGEPDLMIAARKGSPLAVGHGEGEMFIGSDAVALAPFTDRITYLEDGDHAIIRRSGAEIFDAEGRPANREIAQIDVGATQIDKGGYRHFMAKEVAEQPVVLGDALSHYIKGDRIVLPEALDFRDVDRLTLVGCGTAHLAGHVAKYWFESLAGLPCDLDVASEFRYREPPLSDSQPASFSHSSAVFRAWLTKAGMARRSSRCAASSASLMRPRSCAAFRASTASTANWQVNALDEATQTSIPASVGSATSVSRAMAEVPTFTTPTVLATLSRA